MKRAMLVLVWVLVACSQPDEGALGVRTEEVRCREVSINGAPAERLCYREHDGLAIYQDDIVLGSIESLEEVPDEDADEDAGEGKTRALINSASQLAYFAWKSPRIPYTIDPSLPNPTRVTEAIAEFQRTTGVAWVQRTSEPDFVTFRPQSSGACVSSIGRVGGQQFISLVNECSTANVLHEMGHAVGLWHEHCRTDRDQYVTIHFENVTPGLESNFATSPSQSQNFGGYDFASIMHYAYWAFSKNGQPTITKKDGSTAGFGEATTFSAGDLAAIRALFSMNGYVAALSAGAVSVIVGPHNSANDLVSSPQIAFDLAAGGPIALAGVSSDWNWFVVDSARNAAANVIHVVGHFAPPAQMTGACRIFAQVVYQSTGAQGSLTVGPVQVTSAFVQGVNMYRIFNPKLVDFLFTLGWGEGYGAGWDYATAVKPWAVYPYPFQTAASNCTAILMRCRIVNTWRHFLSVNNCGGQTVEGPSGYVCYAAENAPPPNHYGIYRIYHVASSARVSASGPEVVQVLRGGGWAFEGYHGVAVRYAY